MIALAVALVATLMVPPPSPPKQICSGGAASKARIAGRVAPLAAGVTPSIVEIFPTTPLSTAFLQSMHLSLERSHSAADVDQMRSHNAADWATYLASHQSELMATMKIAEPNGTSFTCSGFAPGKYFVVAIARSPLKMAKPYSAYVQNASNFLVYAAQATVAEHAPLASITPFFYVGAVGAPQ